MLTVHQSRLHSEIILPLRGEWEGEGSEGEGRGVEGREGRGGERRREWKIVIRCKCAQCINTTYYAEPGQTTVHQCALREGSPLQQYTPLHQHTY